MSEQAEGQEYLSMKDAAAAIGWNRATVYEWIKRLGLKTHKFIGNRQTYLAVADVERLKEIKQKPWIAGEKKSEEVV